MKQAFSAFVGAFRAELLQTGRSRLLVILSFVQAVTFLLLVSLFGLTGSKAPTALINNDTGPYSQLFIDHLEQAHHSFSLRSMTPEEAQTALFRGQLVAVITIPKNFSRTISYGETAPIDVAVDNLDADLTDDIQRALPSAIVSFGNAMHFPNITVRVKENDAFSHDTGFIPYLVVSALGLDAFVLAGILSAVAVAREFEQGTITQLYLAPVSPLVPLLGRVLVAALLSCLGMGLSIGIVMVGYHITPLHPWEAICALLFCIISFCCVGILLGVLLRKILPVASLIFGLSLPLYIDSGSLEPERFDGNIIWGLAHLSPLYYAIGILEHAFHGFWVTPEPIWVDFLFLLGWVVILLWVTTYTIKRRIAL